jgi:polar amino acid transport system substrate-binding protein
MSQTKFVVVGALALLGAIVFSGRLSDPAPPATDESSAAAGGTLRIGVDSAEPGGPAVRGLQGKGRLVCGCLCLIPFA